MTEAASKTTSLKIIQLRVMADAMQFLPNPSEHNLTTYSLQTYAI
jgi:hypothetical protein